MAHAKAEGLAAGRPALIYRGVDQSKKTFFVEIFTWKAGGAEKAHEDPAVMQVWESTGTHMESRAGRPAMEHPHVQPVRVRFAKV